MRKYITCIFEDAPVEMTGTTTTPVADHLFTVQEDAKPLDEATSKLYHTVTAKLLFLCKRGRPDLQTAVTYLCTQMKAPS